MKKQRFQLNTFATALVLAVCSSAASADSSVYCYKAGWNQNPVKYVDGTLHLATHKGAIEIVEKLLNAGANANSTNSRGYSPLHIAAFAGQADIADLLLNAGADPSVVPKKAPNSDSTLQGCTGVTPLHFAAFHGHVDIVNNLLAAGAEADAAAKDGTTPMYWADRNGHVEVVLTLLNAGVKHQ